MQLGLQVFQAKFTTFEKNVPLAGLKELFQRHAAYLESLHHGEVQAWRQRMLAVLGSGGNLIRDSLETHRSFLPNFPKLPPLSTREAEDLYTISPVIRHYQPTNLYLNTDYQ